MRSTGSWRQVAFDDDGWRLKTDAAEQPARATSTSKSTTPTPTGTPRSTSRPSGWSACDSARASAACTASGSTAPTRPATTASSSRVLKRGRRAVNFRLIAESGTASASSTRRSPRGHATASAAPQRLNRFQASNRFYAANRELGRAAVHRVVCGRGRNPTFSGSRCLVGGSRSLSPASPSPLPGERGWLRGGFDGPHERRAPQRRRPTRPGRRRGRGGGLRPGPSSGPCRPSTRPGLSWEEVRAAESSGAARPGRDGATATRRCPRCAGSSASGR